MEGRLFLDCLGQSVKIERTERNHLINRLRVKLILAERTRAGLPSYQSYD